MVHEDVVSGDPGGKLDRLVDMAAAGYLPPVEGPKVLPIQSGDEEDQLSPDKTPVTKRVPLLTVFFLSLHPTLFQTFSPSQTSSEVSHLPQQLQG